MNIGDTVKYYNEYKEKVFGIITEVASDMDSYEEMRLEDGIPMYYSKKLFRCIRYSISQYHQYSFFQFLYFLYFLF